MPWIVALAIVWLFLMAVAPGAATEEITEGSLQALDKDQKPLGYCPLKHTEVTAEISGFIARVTLTQKFTNPYPDPIEAVYTFPMSDRAAVDRMMMRIGDRLIKGVVKEREEARRIYEAARQAGKAASLLDQERPNIFTQSVANIMPKANIDVTISYVEYLKYEEGEFEFSFPMVVGPRYIPGSPTGHGTDQVPDAGRITPPITPEGTRAGHDISLTVLLDAGLSIQSIHSVLHKVEVERPTDAKAIVRLAKRKEIPNRDFVLKYAVASEAIEDAVLTHHGDKGGFFTLVLHPPKRVAADEATPKEMIFVIDCSGSMRGFPIEKAKKTMQLCIERMNPKDTFNLISFAGGTGYCFREPRPNTRESRAQALKYLRELEGRGGTEMMGAIRAALAGPYDDTHLRVVCFMTDGFIGNDMAILDEIRRTAKSARVFSFGIGNSVNRFLIENMAKEGRGAAAIVTLESKGDEAAERFHKRIHRPVLTDISVDFGGLAVTNVYPDPKALPDLFSAEPVVLKGRYGEAGAGAVTIRGKTARGPFERTLDVTLPEARKEHDVLAPLWARARIDALMAEDWAGIQHGQPDKDVKQKVTRLGLEFSLVTQFTSFVAVEEKVINKDGKPQRVEVPIEMPDGVSYEGIFGYDINGVPPAMAMGAPMYAPSGVRQLSKFEGRALSAPPPPVMAEVSEEARPSRTEPEEDKTYKGKLHPALRDLKTKLVNGNYTAGDVLVKDGWVKVFLRLTDTSDKNLARLKELGVDIVSTAHSSQTVLAKVKVDDLEDLAKLKFVKRIEPPTY